jgi:hypothetical protein
VRPHGEGAGDRDALLLAGGEVLDQSLPDLSEPERPQGELDALSYLLAQES